MSIKGILKKRKLKKGEGKKKVKEKVFLTYTDAYRMREGYPAGPALLAVCHSLCLV